MEAEKLPENVAEGYGFVANSVIKQEEFEKELGRRARLQKRLSEGEYVVKFKDKVSENKEIITVAGTAFALGVAFRGLSELRKRRKK